MPISVPYTEPVPVSSTELLVLFFLPCLLLPPPLPVFKLPVSSLHVLCQPRDLFLDFMPFPCYPVVPVCSPPPVLPGTPALLALPLLSPSAPSLIIIGSPQSENSSAQPWMVDPVAPPRTSMPAISPRSVEQLTPPWLIPPSGPPVDVVPSAPLGFLISLAPP